MSVLVSSLVWLVDMQTPSDKLVALYLADCSDDLGACWPSQGTTARRCGLSRGTVIGAVARLEASGLLRRERRFRRDGGQGANAYRWDMTRLESKARPGRARAIADSAEAAERASAEADIADEQDAGTPVRESDSPPSENRTPPVQPLHPPVQPSDSSNRTIKRTVKEKTPTPSKPRRRLSNYPEPTEAEREAVAAFSRAFKARRGSAYLPDPKRDVEAARGLLAGSVPLDRIQEVCDWVKGGRGWWTDRVMTLHGLAARWNEVTAEMGGRAGSGGSKGVAAAEEWKRSLESGPE